MRRYIIGRTLLIPIVLLGIVTVAFLISHVVPANPLSSVLSQRQMDNPEAVAAANAKYGLDKPLIQQYFIYIGNLLRGDAGTSFVTKQPVVDDIRHRLPATIELTVAAMVIAIVGGVSLGILAATRHNKLTDHTGRLFSLVGSSVPVYWSGLVLLLIFSVRLGWLPGPGRLDSRSVAPTGRTGFYTVDSLLDGDPAKFWEATRHLVLPAIVLGWGVMGSVSRIVRASMLDVLGQDYVRTARAKGARESVVVFRHAFRNAMIPALTIIGFSVAFLLTGAVLTESIFSWPGIGQYSVKAAQALDFPAIMGVCILGGVVFLIANFVTDIGYALVDPRDPVVVTTPSEATLALAPNFEVPDPAVDHAVGRRRRSAWLKVPVLISIAIIAFWVVVGFTVSWWAPYDPIARVGDSLQSPSWSHWLGTDGLGRDVLTRTFYGTRQSMPLAVAVLVAGVGIGCVLGATAGFVGGWVDSVIMRIADITLSFPAILLAMVVTAALGKGLYHIAIAMIIVWWPIYARLLRAQILTVKAQEHVEAARAAGAGRWRVLMIHVLPLSMTPVLVSATMDFGVIVLLAAGLSYVGLGAVPPTPEWGLSINEGTLYFQQWWVAAGPGIAILSIVLAFNFLGDGLRDYLDVRMR